MPGLDYTATICSAVFLSLVVVIHRTSGRMGFGINARSSCACIGDMLAIACCYSVSYVYHAAVPLWVSCCRRGSHVSYVQNSCNAWFGILLDAYPMLDDAIYRDIY